MPESLSLRVYSANTTGQSEGCISIRVAKLFGHHKCWATERLSIGKFSQWTSGFESFQTLDTGIFVLADLFNFKLTPQFSVSWSSETGSNQVDRVGRNGHWNDNGFGTWNWIFFFFLIFSEFKVFSCIVSGWWRIGYPVEFNRFL